MLRILGWMFPSNEVIVCKVVASLKVVHTVRTIYAIESALVQILEETYVAFSLNYNNYFLVFGLFRCGVDGY